MMKRLLWFSVFMAVSLAHAQRGGGNRPLSNYEEVCASDVGAGVSCAGYEKTFCAKDTEQEHWWCSPITHSWKLLTGTGSGGSGAGTSTIQEDSTELTDNATYLDFGAGFDVALSTVDAADDKVTITLDYTENPVDLSTSEVTNNLPVTKGGTNATDATTARSNLSAAKSGSNSDITALNNLTTPLSLSQGGLGINTSTSLTDKVPVGQTSTSVAWTAVPDCDATGNQLGYVASTHTFECAADGAGGSGIEASEEGVDVTAAARSRINFIGDAITAADNSGSSRIDVTLSQSPSTSTSVVGIDRTLTLGAGILGTSADLSANRTIAVDSTEVAFLTDGGASSLTCGAAAGGKAQVMDNGVLQWCDGAATSTLRYSALADSSGNAATGDSATSFFAAGALDVNRGGTGVQTLGSTTQVLFNDGGFVGYDETPGSFTYNKSTDLLTVGAISTFGVTDGNRYLELQGNPTTAPSAPSSGFARFYALGTAGSESPYFRTLAGIAQIATLAGTETLTNKTLTTPVETGKIDRNNVTVDDDDCTGEQGLYWYDTTDQAFEFCNANSGAPSTLSGAVSGDITAVWQTASGAANAIVGSTGDSIDASAADFVRLPIDKTIDTAGKIGIDTTTTLDQLQVFMGGAVRAIDPMRSAGAVLESLVSTDDNYEFFEAPQNVTIIGVSCRCRGTCSTPATFTLEDRGGNAMTITGTNPTCSTTGNSTYAAVTAGNTLVAGEGLAFDVTNSPTTGDTYTITVQYTVDPQ